MILRGNKQSKDELVKMCGENVSKWKEYLPIVPLEDRISAEKTTVYLPFEIQFGQKAVLPIHIETNTYLAIELNKISTMEELLEARSIHIPAKEENKLRDSRKKSVRYLGKTMEHKLRDPLQPGSFVLVHNKTLESQPYEFEELDDTKLTRKFAASHINRFYPRGNIVHLALKSGNESSDKIEVGDSILEEEEIENHTDSD
ncbi:hypothetical protein O181_038646 [Austropuccinia psidii MF-1]|uniref:Uncharacterized protein n=1 Tax=Austropuccinia psidii MF-1 TaxID=1389203 RepID=A0A9Q3D8B9_9BASI|nr:hypothetical protein [Austropuccinia psidii MF-1]